MSHCPLVTSETVETVATAMTVKLVSRESNNSVTVMRIEGVATPVTVDNGGNGESCSVA